MLAAQGWKGDRSRVLIVGDRFDTDIKGGSLAGVRTAPHRTAPAVFVESPSRYFRCSCRGSLRVLTPLCLPPPSPDAGAHMPR